MSSTEPNLIVEITTISGTVYTIDPNTNTWHRLRAEGASKIRTDSGTYILAYLRGDGRLVLLCPPIVPETVRVITSTPVVRINRTRPGAR